MNLKEYLTQERKRVTDLLTPDQLESFNYIEENYEVDSRDFIIVDFDGTNLEINMLNGIGLRVLRTVFSNFKDAFTNISDLHFEEYLFMERKGDNMFEHISDPERLGELYALRNYIAENIEKVQPLSFEEILQMNDVSEEWKALCFTSNELDVSSYLNEVDSFTSKTKNYKGVPITYTLFKGTVTIMGEEMPLTYVRTYDASTDRMFFLQVYNSITRAEDAAACLIRIPEAMHSHLTRLYRQGEKYIAEFDIDDSDPIFNQKMSTTPKYLTGKQYYDVLEYEA